MIEGNDGGAHISFNGGGLMVDDYNQKTAQFYRIDIDNHIPNESTARRQGQHSISGRGSNWGGSTGGLLLTRNGEIRVHSRQPEGTTSSMSAPSAPARAERRTAALRHRRASSRSSPCARESTGIAPRT